MSIYTYTQSKTICECLGISFEENPCLSDQELDKIPKDVVNKPISDLQSKYSKLSRIAYKERLNSIGPTEKELANWKGISSERCKAGLHRTKHSAKTKKIISEKKKAQFIDKSNHPLWGINKYEITSPTGEKYIISGGWTQWCKERGISHSNLRQRGYTKGWVAKIVHD